MYLNDEIIITGLVPTDKNNQKKMKKYLEKMGFEKIQTGEWVCSLTEEEMMEDKNYPDDEILSSYVSAPFNIKVIGYTNGLVDTIVTDDYCKPNEEKDELKTLRPITLSAVFSNDVIEKYNWEHQVYTDIEICEVLDREDCNVLHAYRENHCPNWNYNVEIDHL